MEVQDNHFNATLKQTSSSTRREPNSNDVMILYEYDDPFDDDDDLIMDIKPSNYLFSFSIIALPVIFILVIMISLIDKDNKSLTLRCRIGQVLMIIGVIVGILALYLVHKYVKSINDQSDETINSTDSVENNLGPIYLPSNILQNPLLKIDYLNYYNKKKPYHNKMDHYFQNGLYSAKNHNQTQII